MFHSVYYVSAVSSHVMSSYIHDSAGVDIIGGLDVNPIEKHIFLFRLWGRT